jgi:protein tyrosine phosphatase (PTP) superfamily phosphohydrolase (DUF442 family)
VNFSQITECLYIGDTPGREDYDLLRELGIRLVINMRLEKRSVPDRHQPPLRFLWLPTVDSPGLVIPIFFLIRGARAALRTIAEGGHVYAHCQKGRHRGVAMGACILIAQGYQPDEAMELIKLLRPNSDPDIFYIRSRIMKFAKVWRG